MPQEFCPHCGALRNMSVSTSRQKVVDADGNAEEVVTRTYHCEECHRFVRSERLDDAGTGGVA